MPTRPSLPSAAFGDNGSAPPPVSMRRVLWPLGLSLLVMGVIGYFTFEIEPFRDMLRLLDGWLLAAAIASVVLRVYFGGWRLQYVSHGRLNLMAGLRGQLAWDFFSNITPSTVGGGPIAAAYIARDRNIPLGEATAFMLFSMLLDQLWFALSIPLLLGAGLYYEIIPAELGTVGALSFTIYFVVLMLWVVIFGYATLFRPEVMERVVDRLFRMRWLRRWHDKAVREMQQLGRRARVLRSQTAGFYLKGFALTLATWAARYALIVLIIWSVFPDLDKMLAFLRSVALTLGSLILPTPGGSGGLEGLYALLMAPLMPEALVAPTLLTWRLLGYYIFVALGIFLSMHHVVQKALRRRSVPTGDGQPEGTPVFETTETLE